MTRMSDIYFSRLLLEMLHLFSIDACTMIKPLLNCGEPVRLSHLFPAGSVRMQGTQIHIMHNFHCCWHRHRRGRLCSLHAIALRNGCDDELLTYPMILTLFIEDAYKFVTQLASHI